MKNKVEQIKRVTSSIPDDRNHEDRMGERKKEDTIQLVLNWKSEEGSDSSHCPIFIF